MWGSAEINLFWRQPLVAVSNTAVFGTLQFAAIFFVATDVAARSVQ